MTATIAAYLILSTIVQKVTERVRARWPKVDGDLVIAVAFIVSAVFCLLVDFRAVSALANVEGLPDWADLLGTAIAVTVGAGALADILSKAKPKPTDG